MPPKKDNKKAAKGYTLPDPIPPGLILCDVLKQQWRLGKSVGQGGFGEIYLASDVLDKPVSCDSNFVVKIEPHSNGPLFTEMHCYMRIGRPEGIENWKKQKRLKHLGMPKYLGSGSHEYKGQKYRFMVMERFGDDLQKIINKHSKKFSYRTVVQVVIQVLDVLEYIHFHGYIHADIKASNLLVGHRPGTDGFVYLVDYGLACRYSLSSGKHKEYKYDQRRAHDGTIEFTSRDAHIGAHSRRGDLEILGYNLVQWLSGRLPWEDNLGDCNYVANKKRTLMGDIPRFMDICFPDAIPPGVQEYMEYVASLTFDECPSYEKCRMILREGLTRRGYSDDGKLVFLSATPKVPSKKKNRKHRSEEAENLSYTPVKKRMPSAGRLPCKPRNFNNRFNTRLCPNEQELGISLSRLPNGLELSTDSEDKLIEKENLKMLERHKKLQPHKRHIIEKDESLSNPTPQMLEIISKMRERNCLPPTCPKKRRSSGSNCEQQADERKSEFSGLTLSPLTPAMIEVMRKKQENEASSPLFNESFSYSSPDFFSSGEDDDDSDYCDEDILSDNSTIFYSPCSSDISSHSSSSSRRSISVRNYSARRRRVSLSYAEKRSKVGHETRRVAAVKADCKTRLTRRTIKKYSPEIL